MSPGQRQEYERLLEQKKARNSPLEYMLYDSPKKNKRYSHTVLLNEVVMALVEKRLYKSGPGPASIVIDVTEDEPNGRRVHPETGEPALSKLMTSMPPRIGKSFFFGKYFPAWFLTLFPDESIMYMSYGASLAQRFSKLSRDVLNEHPELGTLLDPDNQSVVEWGVDGHDGGFIARGFGGIPTGRGGNLLIDDPFQDGADAMSDLQRDRVWEAYVSSLITRVEAGCWTIVNGTRWHEDDLHGRLLEHEPDEWYVINLPAISFDDANDDGISMDLETGQVDPLGRRPGKAICPPLYSKNFYRKRQAEDPFWYDAEYLGKPAGIGGGLFKEFSHYKKHVTDHDVIYEAFTGNDQSEFVSEKDCVRFATADLAATDKQTADWYVMAIWDMDYKRRVYLREIVREHVTAGSDDEWMRTNYKKWNVRVLGVEESTYDYKLIRDMIIAGGINIWPLPADKNKKVRALPAAVLFKKHLVFVDRDAEWRAKYESEMKKFDKDKNDDQVDATSYMTVMRDLLKANPLPTVSAVTNKISDFDAYMAKLADSRPKEDTPGMILNG